MATYDALMTEAKSLIERVKASGGNCSPADAARLDSIKPEILAAKAHEKAIADGDALLAQFKAAGNPTGPAAPGEKFSLNAASFKAAAGEFTKQASKQATQFGAKAVFSGAAYTVQLGSNGILPLGRTTASVSEAINSEFIDGRHYEFLRQATRANNAALVAEGALKPTSTMGLELIEGTTKVTAHLSEPVDVFMLQDINTLAAFVQAELTGGLLSALDQQVVTGLVNAVGIQTQAFATDVLTTIRNAITKARLAGYSPDLIALSYADWQALELLRENGATGGYLLGTGPVDTAARKLWGLQVVETDKLPATTSLVMDSTAATLKISKPGAQIEWSTIADDFAKNQVRCRAEIRSDLAVERPAAIVKAALV
jgi:HK97 family phage major capsid protein